MGDTQEFPDDDRLFDAIEALNPWWKGGGVPAYMRPEFKRHDHGELVRHMGDLPVHAVLGARQIGKTTVLYQLMDGLISGGDPRRVMFATLDEGALFPSAGNLRRMLNLYARRVLREPLYGLSQRTYIVLDEVQAVKGWQEVLKNVVDRRVPATFIVSGSSGAGISEGLAPLLGRIRHHEMRPMSFAEYALFRGRPYAPAFTKAGCGLRRRLAESVKDGDSGALYGAVKDALIELAVAKSDILLDLSEYMTYGGCPGIASAHGHRRKAEQLKTNLRLSMYHDIVKLGRVRNPGILEPLFLILAQRSPRIVNKERIAKNLGINKITLDAYLGMLKAAYLVSYADLYAPVRSRSEKKVYVCDAGMRNTAASAVHIDALSDSAETGLLAESIAGDHTRRLWAALDPAALPEMPYYWRSGRGDEVDLVVEIGRRPVPIEVKYRRQVGASDLGGLSRFVDRYRPPVALALTQNQARLVGDAVVAVPLWLYLSMCP